MYRRMEFLLGEKSASMPVPHRGAPRVHAELEKALQQPSLYDEALRLLARRGHAIPAEVLERELALRYEPSAEVEEVWSELYRGEQDAELYGSARPSRTPPSRCGAGETTISSPPAGPCASGSCSTTLAIWTATRWVRCRARCRGASRTSFAASGASCASSPGTEPSGPMPIPGGEHPEADAKRHSRALQDAQALLEAVAERYDA